MAQAYEVLSDPDKRARYDRFGAEGVGAGGRRPVRLRRRGGINDIFEAFFGGGSPFGGGQRGPSGPPRGADLELVVDLTLEEAVFGVPPPGRRPRPGRRARPAPAAAPRRAASPSPASSAPGSARCSACASRSSARWSAPRCARGAAASARSSPTRARTAAATAARTEERTYTVDIPAGVDTGSTLRLTGPRRGRARAAGPNGDLYVHVRVRPTTRFTRDGARPALRPARHVRPGRARRPPPVRDARRHRGPRRPHAARRSGQELRLRGQGVPAPRTAATAAT